MTSAKFDALLEAWAGRYLVATVLERAVGAEAAPACAALAGGAVTLTCVVDDDRAVVRARSAYGPNAEVRLASDPREMPTCDLVVIHGAPLGAAGDWRAPLASLLKQASKLAIVLVPNPRAIESRVRNVFQRDASGWGDTEQLAPVLWGAGRVREHLWLETAAIVDTIPRFVRGLSRAHAFVVDVAPRSPQARRKLRLQQAG